MIHWGIKWRSESPLGWHKRGGLLSCHTGLPMIFKTKAEAQAFIRKTYGYIAKRPDLRREPHGWKMPIPVRVKVEVREV